MRPMTARTSAAVMAGLVLLSLLAFAPVAAAAPAVTSVAPNTGPVGGGTNVVITGTGFDPASTVTIGGTAMTGVVVNSATEIVATTPAKPAGTYNLVVTNPDTTTYTFANAFTFAATPTIATLSPASGPTAGGTVVTVTGTNFRAGLTLTVGGTAFTGIVVNSETELVATTPAKAAGCYNVVVTNSDTSTYTKANGFCYGDQPTISTITPSTVGTAGGASVQVTGTNFRAGATITVGGTAGTGVTVNGPTELVFTAPAKAEGTYNVVVTVDGLSYAKANGLSYVPVTNPTIAALTPASGSTAGGTVVAVSGTGFKAGATVTFGGTSGTSVVVGSSTELQVVAPAKTAGTYNVVVTNTDGGSATKLNGWTAVAPPTITSLTPSSGSMAATTVVEVAGTGFASGATGTLAGEPVTVTRLSPTAARFTAPASGAAGTVDFVLTNPSGLSATSTFTYFDPAAPQATTPAFDAGTVIGIVNQDNQYDAFASEDGQLIVVAHTSDTGNNVVLEVSTDGGDTWTSRGTGIQGFYPRVAAASAEEIVVLAGTVAGFNGDGASNALRVIHTTDGYTYSSSTLATAPGSGRVRQYDLVYLPESDTYYAAWNACRNSGGTVCTASVNFDDYVVRMASSTDGGVTWSAAQTVHGQTITGGSLEHPGVSLAVYSPLSWEVFYTYCPCGAQTSALRRSITTNGGGAYSTFEVNDQFVPLSSTTEYSSNLRASDDGNALVMTSPADQGSVTRVAQRTAQGNLWSFTTVQTGSLSGGNQFLPVFNCATNAVTLHQGASGQERIKYDQVSYPDVTTTNVFGGTETVYRPFAAYQVGTSVNVVYGNLADGRTVVRENTNAGCAPPDEGNFIEVATDGLLGFDMSPGGLDTTIITREDGGMVRSYDPVTLLERAEFDTECNDRTDGVSASYPSLAFVFCSGSDPGDPEGFKVRDFFFGEPSGCDYCHTGGNSVGTIDEEGDPFIDTPENTGQIGFVSTYPYTFEGTGSLLGTETTRVVFPFTVTGTGQFGIYAIQFVDGGCQGSGDCAIPDVLEFEQFAPNGQTISQMCSWRTATNGRDLIGVVHAGTGLRLYEFSVNWGRAPLDLTATITPYMTAPGSSTNAVGLACAADTVSYVAADGAGAQGKLVSFYADGPNKGQKRFEVLDIDPFNRGVAMDAGAKYVAYTDYDSAGFIHFLAINGTELEVASIGDRNFYQMALDRPGGALVVAVAPDPNSVSPTGSLLRFDLSAVEGGCGLNCTDTNADPYDPSCGTGCGEDDPSIPDPGGPDSDGDGVADADEKVGLLQVKARTGLYLTGVALLVFLAIGYRFTAGNRQREPKEEEA